MERRDKEIEKEKEGEMERGGSKKRRRKDGEMKGERRE